MMPDNPIELLKSITTSLETRRTLGSLLSCVRRIDESDTQTLERLIKERAAVVKLLRSHPAAQDDHSFCDFEYKENFFTVIEKYLVTKPVATEK